MFLSALIEDFVERPGERRFGLVGVVDVLDYGKADADLAAEQLIAAPVPLAVFTFAGPRAQAGKRTTVAVVEAVVAGEQEIGKQKPMTARKQRVSASFLDLS